MDDNGNKAISKICLFNNQWWKVLKSVFFKSPVDQLFFGNHLNKKEDKKNKFNLGYEAIILAAAIFAIMLSFYIESKGMKVFVPLGKGIEVPETCVFKTYSGIRCPACGLTRSFINISDGNIVNSLKFNYGGIVAYLYVLFQIPYRILRIKKSSSVGKLYVLHRYFSVVVVSVLFISWLFGGKL